MNLARNPIIAASVTRRHLPPRCSRITSSRPNRISNVPRTFEMHSFNGMPIATLRPKGSNSGTPLGISGTTIDNPVNGATAANANNVGNNTTTNRVNVEIFYVHPDHLGTPRVVTRSTVATGANAPSSATPTSPGAINKAVWMWNSDPFGTTGTTGAGGSANSAPAKNPQLVTGTAVQIAAATFEQNLRMPGQFEDQETKSFYNYFRDLDPFTGRYKSSDPIGLGGGISTYAYSKAQPCRLADRLGLWTQAAEVLLFSQFLFGGGKYLDISVFCPEYFEDEQVKWAKKNLEREIDAKAKSCVGFKGTDTFQIRRNAHLYVWSIYSFGSGIGHLQDADCTVVGDGCCARVKCSTRMKAIDRYSNPLALRERLGLRNGAENLGGTVFWFGLSCSGNYSSEACGK
jgi:RHS repeat-associated protein